MVNFGSYENKNLAAMQQDRFFGLAIIYFHQDQHVGIDEDVIDII